MRLLTTIKWAAIITATLGWGCYALWALYVAMGFWAIPMYMFLFLVVAVFDILGAK